MGCRGSQRELYLQCLIFLQGECLIRKAIKINFSKSLGLEVFSLAVYRIKSSLVTVKRKK